MEKQNGTRNYIFDLELFCVSMQFTSSGPFY